MNSIKISQESLDAFKGGKKLVPAPIDDKCLLEDPFEDNVFDDFYAAPDHRKGSRRHLFGHVSADTEKFYFDGFVEVSWNYGDNTICIELKAVSENYEEMKKDCYDYYRSIFKLFEHENEGLIVDFERGNELFVSFFETY